VSELLEWGLAETPLGDPDAIDAALGANRTIPARWYWDPAVFERELDGPFARSWQVVAPLEKLARPGDRVVGRIGRIPILVVRDRDESLRGYVNVCRHRAYPVVTEDGNRMTLQCGYHAWTYDLDGRLRSAPRCRRELGTDAPDVSLLPIAVDTWRGFVWANPDADAAPLLDANPELESLLRDRGIDFSGYDYVHRDTTRVDANWKLWVENAAECYHCPSVHTQSFADAWDVGPDEFELITEGRISVQLGRPNPASGRFPNATNRFLYLYLFPGSFVTIDDFILVVGSIIPTSPDSCHVVSDVYFARGADRASLHEWLDMYTQTVEEDVAAIRKQLDGLSSRTIDYGYLLPESETSLLHFHRVLWSALRA
jgi:phenylpropionate dioxygenase-like ring-hydroxylating dioxygenase large terminal subunit